MNKFLIYINSLILALLICSNGIAQSSVKVEKTGWRLGMQSYTFHKFSFQEAVDKTQQLGIKYMEVYYGQVLGKDIPGTMDFKMDQATQQKVLAYAKSKGVKIVASGVVICKDEAEWKQLFEFAAKMGIETITCEPEYKHLKYIDQLANKYKIDVAIHNHPKPSPYWNPDLFLEAVKGLSNRIGACADVGHWKRMDIDPVEALKKCEGRLKSLHFKDIKEKESGEAEQHDVIWGTGVCNVEGMLKELKRQNFNGLFSIEYEYNWDNSLPDIRQCITNFNKMNDLKYIAHRGASYYAPENSLAAIKLAWKLGSDGAECDIQLTRDNQIVLWHDSNTERLTNQKFDVAKATYAELKKLDIKLSPTNSTCFEGQRMPLLKDVLKAMPDNQLLVIEIKCGNEIFPELQKVIKQYWKKGNIAFIAFNFETISMAKSIYPEVPCYFLSSVKADVLNKIPEIKKNKLDGVDLYSKIIDHELVDELRKANSEIWCWTVDALDETMRMKDLGVNTITTNRPTWLKEQIAAKKIAAK